MMKMATKLFLTVFLSCYFTISSYAQKKTIPHLNEQLATVHIRGWDGEGWNLLTGVIISYHKPSNTAICITNSHLFEPNPAPIQFVDVWPATHPKPYRATTLVYYKDREKNPDVAVLLFKPSFPVYAIPLASKTPPNATNIRIRGYGKGNLQKLKNAQIANKGKYLSGTFELTVPIVQGDSGSPVFWTNPNTNKSEVAGLCWGSLAEAYAEPIKNIDVALTAAYQRCINGVCSPSARTFLFPRVFKRQQGFFQSKPNPIQTKPLQAVQPPFTPPTPGPQGIQGIQGFPGKNAQIDYSKLDAIIESRIKPILGRLTQLEKDGTSNEIDKLKQEIEQLRNSIPASFQIVPK